MTQRPRADNLRICWCKKQIDGSFPRVCPIIDDGFHDNISLKKKVMMKFIITDNRRDA